MQQTLGQTKIGNLMFIYLLIFSVVITIIISVIELSSGYERDVDRVNKTLNELNISYRNGLSSALWLADKDQLQSMLAGITELADIRYAVVLSEGSIYAQSGSDVLNRTNKNGSENITLEQKYISSSMPLTYAHRGKEVPIGRVILYTDLSDVRQKLNRRILMVLATNGAEIALIVLFFYFLFYYLISRHLENISGYLNASSAYLPDLPLVLDRKKPARNDELDILADSINSMYSKLDFSLKELEEKQELLLQVLSDKTQESQNNRLLFESSPVGLALADMTGTLVDVNQSYADILGRTVEECKSVESREPISDKYADEENEHLCMLKETGYCGPYEREYIHKDGHHVAVRISDMVLERDGESFIWSSVENISDIKKAFSDLEYSQARFAAVFSSISDAVVMANTDHRMTVLSDSVTDLFGYEASELQGRPTGMLSKNTEDFSQAGGRNALPGSLPYEVEYRRKDGSTFWGETLGTKIVSEDGVIYGYVGIIRDVTERKNVENELKKYRHQLEKLVAERTRKLRDAQDELVRNERLATLGQLTATVSHELRNPLGAMRPSLYVIDKKSDREDERLQSAIERVDRNIERCDRIIDELLDFTRITDLDRHLTRIDDWLESVIDDQCIPEHIRVEKDFSLNNVEMAIDTGRLRRAVINVVENACHTMELGKQQTNESRDFRLKIKTGSNAERIEIAIADTGDGIPDNVLEKIFEPLFSTRGFGVGLGMSTVKQIMEQHDGGVEIDTKVDQGTNVILWLPRG